MSLDLHALLLEEMKGERELVRDRERARDKFTFERRHSEDGRLFGTFFSASSVYHCRQRPSSRRTVVLISALVRNITEQKEEFIDKISD